MSERTGDRRQRLDHICTQLLSPQCTQYVEDFLSSLPGCSADELLDLIDAEVCRRSDLGEAPALAEYARRFPSLGAAALSQLFEVHLLETATRRQREVPQYCLPGLAQGAIVARDGNSEVRRARVTSQTQWGAVRTFSTETWDTDARAVAAAMIDAAGQIQHRHLLSFTSLALSDERGNLFARLPNVEGASLRSCLTRPMSPRQAAAKLLPVVGAVHSAAAEGVDLGDVQLEHLRLDHFDRVCLLGMGRLPDAPKPRSEQPLAMVLPARIAALGQVWRELNKLPDGADAEPLPATSAGGPARSPGSSGAAHTHPSPAGAAMPTSRASIAGDPCEARSTTVRTDSDPDRIAAGRIAEACLTGAYRSLDDLLEDLDRLLNLNVAPHSREWRYQRSHSQLRWLRWR
ncbi:MAG: hypothetical protein KDB14_10585 [Planctomycetales bacterium]|nr:hypothetical protein [Planctomycetales bacterium]